MVSFDACCYITFPDIAVYFAKYDAAAVVVVIVAVDVVVVVVVVTTKTMTVAIITRI